MKQSILLSLLAVFTATVFGLFACAPKQARNPSPAPEALVEDRSKSEAAEEEELAQGLASEEVSDSWQDDQGDVEEEQPEPIDENPEQPTYEDSGNAGEERKDDYGDNEDYEGEW